MTRPAANRRSDSAVERWLRRIKRNKIITLVITLGAATIALSHFTDAIEKLGKFFGLRTEQSDSEGAAKDKIRTSIEGIDFVSAEEARRRLTILEGYVAELNTPQAKQAALQELVNVIFHDNSRSGRIRDVRKSVMAAVIRINGLDLSRLFAQHSLENLDFYEIDFSNADLHGLSFKNCFLVKTSFERARLDGADFSGASMRNAKFNEASTIGTIFRGADWFNAGGLSAVQLERSQKSTLLSCPKDESAMMDYLANNYAYSFEGWGSEIQNELRSNWQKYWAAGGLASMVDQWNERGVE